MNLVIRGHPLERMTQRGVTEEDIVHALEHYHSSFENPPQDSITYIGPGVDGRELKVFLLRPGLQDPDASLVVKSVAWR